MDLQKWLPRNACARHCCCQVSAAFCINSHHSAAAPKNMPVKYQPDPDSVGIDIPKAPRKVNVNTGDITLALDLRDKWLRLPIRRSLAVTKCHHHSIIIWTGAVSYGSSSKTPTGDRGFKIRMLCLAIRHQLCRMSASMQTWQIRMQ